MDPHEAQLYTGRTFAGKNGSYLVGGLIGSGGFGGVFEGVDQGSGEDVALKVLAFTGRPANAQLEFEAEIELLRLLVACSNVVTLLDGGIYNVSLTTGGLIFPVQVPFMVLDRATVGLEELLAQRHQLSWLDRMRLYRDVVKGCHQMHLKRLVHRDLKAANALVYDQEPYGRITDLGRSKDTRQPPRFPPKPIPGWPRRPALRATRAPLGSRRDDAGGLLPDRSVSPRLPVLRICGGKRHHGFGADESTVVVKSRRGAS